MRALQLLAFAIAVAACEGETDPGGGAGSDAGGDAQHGDGQVAPDAPANATAHEFCISETNRYRIMDGRPAIAFSQQLETYADTGAMVDFGTSPHNHFTSTGGGGIAFAENECPQQGGWTLSPDGDMKALVGRCVMAFYGEGPGTGTAHGHYNNMMGPYGHLGCGVYQSGSGVTIVQDFGN